MRLGFVGDVHGDIYSLTCAVDALKSFHGVEWVCCVGDLGVGFWEDREMFVEALNESGLDATILGNHDEQGTRGWNDSWKIDGHEVQLLPRGSRLNLDGCNLLFMGGAESIDRAWRTEGASWWPGESITYGDIQRVDYAIPTDVVVTHTMPNFALRELMAQDRLPCYNLNGSEKLLEAMWENLAEVQRPSLWVGGHWHRRSCWTSRGTRFALLNRIDKYDGDTIEDACCVLDTETMEIDYPLSTVRVPTMV